MLLRLAPKVSFAIRNIFPSYRRYGILSHTRSWSSNEVYEAFIKFYIERDHHFIQSSSVIPWNDPSLFFVNAGMNQFKPILLGHSSPSHHRAVNSQKCIRVKGKHNDLADVGTDTYHHTFFEMLGSWSFGDYFKRTAITQAWQLMTEDFNLPPDRLYVTYFAGDDKLGLPPDLETLQIWEKLGVDPKHILPFGTNANFWEMGAVGPCGPCTEIHYWRGEVGAEAAYLVNGGFEELVELWNIVFIQHQRHPDGSVTRLPERHVDTGMGLERLTAVLNNKLSNYDTDIFIPLFDTLHQVSGCSPYRGSLSCPQDTAYRVVVDHARMATVAIADGCLPVTNHILRSILRRLYTTAESQFGLPLTGLEDLKANWLTDLNHAVVSTLSLRHPLLLNSLSRVQNVMAHELQHYTQSREAFLPAWEELVSSEPLLSQFEHCASLPLTNALRQIVPLIKQHSGSALPPDVAVKAKLQFGISFDMLEELAGLYNVGVDQSAYEEELEANKRTRSLQRSHKSNTWGNISLANLNSQLKKRQIEATNRKSLYSYKRVPDNQISHCDNTAPASRNFFYVFEDVKTSVLAIVKHGKFAEECDGRGDFGLVLRDSNFYTEAGGQVGDQGTLEFDDGRVFDVKHAESAGNHVIHWGSFGEENDTPLKCGARLVCKIKADRRLGCSQHHTATHLIHKAFSDLAGETTQQLSSFVAHNHFTFEVGASRAISMQDILSAEKKVQEWIKLGGSVERTEMPLGEALRLEGVALVPGAVYPDTVGVVTAILGGGNRPVEGETDAVEVCCGTHLLDVADVEQFVVTNVGSTEGLGLRHIRCVCGPVAHTIIGRGQEALQQLAQRLNDALSDSSDSAKEKSKKWAKSLLKQSLPYEAKAALQDFSNNINKIFRMKKDEGEIIATNKVLEDMKRLHNLVPPQVGVVTIVCSPQAHNRNIIKTAYNIFQGRSALVVILTNGAFQARAFVSEDSMSKGASAVDWLAPILERFVSGTITAGKNPKSLATFRGALISQKEMEAQRDHLQQSLEQYINKFQHNFNEDQTRS